MATREELQVFAHSMVNRFLWQQITATELVDEITEALLRRELYYRSEGEPFDVELRRDGCYVVMNVFSMPTRLIAGRSETIDIYTNKFFRVRSSYCPAIDVGEGVVWLLGSSGSYDVGMDKLASEEEARVVLEKLVRTFSEMNELFLHCGHKESDLARNTTTQYCVRCAEEVCLL